jgi:hypothetical protein
VARFQRATNVTIFRPVRQGRLRRLSLLAR